MASTSIEGPSSGGNSLELSEALAAARDALLLFADSQGVLGAMVGDGAGATGGYADLRDVRQNATVDDLLGLVAGTPPFDSSDATPEAIDLYPTLLELAEVFDLLIDQYSLVYGDAVALAEAIAPGWHAMAGCHAHDDASDAGAMVRRQLEANLADLAAAPGVVEPPPPARHREIIERLLDVDAAPWRAEARHLAAHTVNRWLPDDAGIPFHLLDPIRAATGRTGSLHATGGGDAALVARATGDLILARLTRGVARDIVTDVLSRPLTRTVPRR